MGRWIELKIKIEEKPFGSEEGVEILNASEGVDEAFLEMVWNDWDIEVPDEKWKKYLKERGEKNGEEN